MDVKDHKSIETEEAKEEELDCEQLQLARPTSWTNSKTGKIVHGMEVFTLKYEFDIDNRSKNTGQRDDFDVCPICYLVWTSNGTHRICCLPCGHVYGFSCIKAWLEIGFSRKYCPQCKTACTLKDVNLLYVTLLHIPDAASADQIADQKPSTRRFPYSSAGVKAYRDYELGRLLHASNKRSIVLKRRADVLGKKKVAMKRLTELLNLKAHTEKLAKSLEQRADAMGLADTLRRQADTLGQWANEYLRKADAFGRRADAFSRRAKALFQRLEKLDASILVFRQCLREHRGLVRMTRN